MPQEAQRRGSIAQGRRIDIVESRSAIPVRLPSGMRPMVAEKSCIRNECALYGVPRVEILRLVQRPHKSAGHHAQKQAIDEPRPMAKETIHAQACSTFSGLPRSIQATMSAQSL